MNLAKKLEDSNFDTMLSQLESEGNELAYGSTYSIQEVRKAIKDGQQVFAEIIGGKILNFVGENPNSLVVQKDNEYFSIEDKKLIKAWTGNVAIITGERETESESEKEHNDYVIFAPDRDTWPMDLHEKKSSAKNIISQIKYFPPECLPAHPAIVIFTKPEKEHPKDIRAMLNGAEISIIDPSDPVTEFLHELGHMYWETRLTNEEKDKFKELHEKLDKNKPPSIFFSKDSYGNPEEMFCTVYLWYAKGKLLNEGYTEILHKTYHDGHKCLIDIMTRIKSDKDSQAVAIASSETMCKAWTDNERQISFWLNQIQGNTKVRLGRRIVKARIPIKDPRSIAFPDSIEHEILSEVHGRKWIMVKAGACEGKIIIIKNGYLDIPFIKANKKRLHLIPAKKSFSRNGKNFEKTVWVKRNDINKLRKSISMEEIDRASNITFSLKAKQAARNFIRRIKSGVFKRR